MAPRCATIPEMKNSHVLSCFDFSSSLTALVYATALLLKRSAWSANVASPGPDGTLSRHQMCSRTAFANASARKRDSASDAPRSASGYSLRSSVRSCTPVQFQRSTLAASTLASSLCGATPSRQSLSSWTRADRMKYFGFAFAALHRSAALSIAPAPALAASTSVEVKGSFDASTARTVNLTPVGEGSRATKTSTAAGPAWRLVSSHVPVVAPLRSRR
mmetsp:Transcript_59684/g.164362  ORF Transcript_59684/g.164362 Transcript_59684/m.164362 type:complete len:218 (-) Transcript_59684:11-664(-)